MSELPLEMFLVETLHSHAGGRGGGGGSNSRFQVTEKIKRFRSGRIFNSVTFLGEKIWEVLFWMT